MDRRYLYSPATHPHPALRATLSRGERGRFMASPSRAAMLPPRPFRAATAEDTMGCDFA
ncbi:hypothetical protein [Paludisphaera sp.]|uniref:hypothetical protein n=1 Tax=Paludisphaera sp. TaxID=2017432 RepID=UPI00301E42DC